VTLYPASPDAAYAQYLIGESYFLQIPDVTRDQEMSRKAVQAMGEVYNKYPTPNTQTTRAKGRTGPQPDRRQGDAGRTLLPGTRASIWPR
jgi:hypothetical protein